jgi:hypothetical protein
LDLIRSPGREATWSIVRITAVVGLAAGLMIWPALNTKAPSQSTFVYTPPVSGDFTLDRGAERAQYGPILRVGGPGGEIETSSGQTVMH